MSAEEAPDAMSREDLFKLLHEVHQCQEMGGEYLVTACSKMVSILRAMEEEQMTEAQCHVVMEEPMLQSCTPFYNFFYKLLAQESLQGGLTKDDVNEMVALGIRILIKRFSRHNFPSSQLFLLLLDPSYPFYANQSYQDLISHNTEDDRLLQDPSQQLSVRLLVDVLVGEVWCEGRIEELGDSIVRIRCLNCAATRWIPAAANRIAPHRSRTTVSYLDGWRSELCAKARVDAEDTVHKWYTATVVSIDGERVYITYDGWGSRYDEWMHVSSPRLAPYRSIAKGGRKRGGEQLASNQRFVCDIYDPQDTCAVYRGLEGGSLSLVGHLRTLDAEQVFTSLLDRCRDTKEPLPVSILFNYCFVLSRIAHLFTKSFCTTFCTPFVEAVLNTIESYPSDVIRRMQSQILDGIMNASHIILCRIMSRMHASQKLDTFYIHIAIKRLKSDLIESQLYGLTSMITYLKKLIVSAQELTEVSEWVQSLGILPFLFREADPHPEIIKRSTELVKLHCELRCFSTNDLGHLWNMYDKLASSSFEAKATESIIDLIQEMLPLLEETLLDYTLQRIEELKPQHVSKALLKVVCSIARQANAKGLTAQRAFECLWRYAQDDIGDSDEANAVKTAAVEEMLQTVKFSPFSLDVKPVLMNCLSNVATGLSRSRSIRVLRTILKEYATESKKELIHELEQHNLTLVLLEDIVLLASQDSLAQNALFAELQARLFLLRDIIQDSTIELAMAHIDTLWRSVNSLHDAESDDPIFQFLFGLLKSERSVKRSDANELFQTTLISMQTSIYIFNAKLVTIDAASLSIDGYDVFERFFLMLNMAKGLLERRSRNVSLRFAAMCTSDLPQLSYLWDVALQSHHADVAKRASKLLWQCYFSLKDHNTTSSAALAQQFVDRCVNALAEQHGDTFVIANASQLLQRVILDAEKRDRMHCFASTTHEPLVPHVAAVLEDYVTLMVEIHGTQQIVRLRGSDTLFDVKTLFAFQMDRLISQVRLKIGNTGYTSSEFHERRLLTFAEGSQMISNVVISTDRYPKAKLPLMDTTTDMLHFLPYRILSSFFDEYCDSETGLMSKEDLMRYWESCNDTFEVASLDKCIAIIARFGRKLKGSLLRQAKYEFDRASFLQYYTYLVQSNPKRVWNDLLSKGYGTTFQNEREQLCIMFLEYDRQTDVRQRIVSNTDSRGDSIFAVLFRCMDCLGQDYAEIKQDVWKILKMLPTDPDLLEKVQQLDSEPQKELWSSILCSIPHRQLMYNLDLVLSLLFASTPSIEQASVVQESFFCGPGLDVFLSESATLLRQTGSKETVTLAIMLSQLLLQVASSLVAKTDAVFSWWSRAVTALTTMREEASAFGVGKECGPVRLFDESGKDVSHRLFPDSEHTSIEKENPLQHIMTALLHHFEMVSGPRLPSVCGKGMGVSAERLLQIYGDALEHLCSSESHCHDTCQLNQYYMCILGLLSHVSSASSEQIESKVLRPAVYHRVAHVDDMMSWQCASLLLQCSTRAAESHLLVLVHHIKACLNEGRELSAQLVRLTLMSLDQIEAEKTANALRELLRVLLNVIKRSNEASAITLGPVFQIATALLQRVAASQVRDDVNGIDSFVLDTLLFFPMCGSDVEPCPQLTHPETRSCALRFLVLLYRSFGFDSILSKIVSLFDTIEFNHTLSIQSRKQLLQSMPYVGMRNLGSTCYMNSLLQQFFMVDAFRDNVLSMDIDAAKLVPEDDLLVQLQSVFVNLHCSVEQSYDPILFCKSYRDLDGNPVNLMMQQDVQEFLNVLIDRLESSLARQDLPNYFKDEFGGVLVNQMICTGGCSSIRERYEDFYTVSISVSSQSDLESSLTSYVSEEILEGVQCDVCEAKQDTKKRVVIEELPSTLIFHLKRFELNYETFQNEKVNSRFEFPHDIDMSRFTKDGVEHRGTQAEWFTLKGVLVHSGNSQSGHYYSFIKTRGGNWFEFNDNYIRHFDPSQLEKETFGTNRDDQDAYTDSWNQDYSWIQSSEKCAYLLLYERKPLPMLLHEPTLSNTAVTLQEEIQQRNRTTLRQALLLNYDVISFVLDLVCSEHNIPASLSERMERLIMRISLYAAPRCKDDALTERCYRTLGAICANCAKISMQTLQEFVSDEEALYKLLLTVKSRQVRAGVAYVIAVCCCSHHHVIDAVLVSVIGTLLLDIAGNICQHMHRIGPLFELCSVLACCCPPLKQLLIEKRALLLFGNGLIACLDQLQANASNSSATIALPDFDNLVLTLQHIIESASVSFQQSQRHHLPLLSDAETELLLTPELYIRCLVDGINPGAIGAILSHLSFECSAFSEHAMLLLLQELSRAKYTNVEPYMEALSYLLSIQDSLIEQRHTMALDPTYGLVHILYYASESSIRFTFRCLECLVGIVSCDYVFAEAMIAQRRTWKWIDSWLVHHTEPANSSSNPINEATQQARSKVVCDYISFLETYGESLSSVSLSKRVPQLEQPAKHVFVYVEEDMIGGKRAISGSLVPLEEDITREGWECPMCTLQNDKDATVCAVCENVKPR